MTDVRTRALERRAVSTGGADDEAAWLLARLRAGDLAPARLRLLVHVGHPAARLAAGATLAEVEAARGVGPARRWALGLGGFGREACARAAVALARACAVGLGEAPPHLGRGVITDLIAALEDALSAPSRSALRAARVAAERAVGDVGWSQALERHELPAALARARLVALEAATAVCAPTGPRAAEAVAQAAAWASPAHDVQAVVREMIVPWALGPRPSRRAPAPD